MVTALKEAQSKVSKVSSDNKKKNGTGFKSVETDGSRVMDMEELIQLVDNSRHVKSGYFSS